MHEAANTAVVKQAYAAFGRGDVQGILDVLDANIVWRAVVGASADVPTSGLRRGKAAVNEFFGLVAASMAFDSFEPREFVAQGDKVVALGHYRAKAVPTGRPFESDFVMVFTLSNGKVTEFQEFTDVAQLNAAFEAVAV